LTELAQKRTAAEQALAGVAAQIEPSQSNVNAAKTQVDTIAAEVAKVEQQLAALQKRLAEEQAKKTTASNDMKTKQQELDALREKSQQLETELANHAMQTQLFEQSYGKK
jgi:chromosome segregation ATPase